MHDIATLVKYPVHCVPDVRLLIAEQASRIVGTVQLHLAARSNARHRAEVAKLLVHPDVQRRSIGRRLMLAVEQAARLEQRSLLALDMRLGDGANAFYCAPGIAGQTPIPWARDVTLYPFTVPGGWVTGTGSVGQR
jgi:GNAT superfamily N-acetyltransferase